MKYGFIGVGNMARAIINGMVKSGIESKSIYAYDTSTAFVDILGEEIKVCNSQKELIETCDVVVLSVKPQILDKITNTIKEDLQNKKSLIISIAVGKTIDYLENNLGKEHSLVRVMPNINAKVLSSTTAYCCNGNVTAEEKKIVENIFGSIGSITEIEEDKFSIFGVIAGSAPAFAYAYIDALATAALKAGMPKNQAIEIVASTVLGSAKMVYESNEHPISLVDQVCSPGGTTIEGITSLKKDGFEKALINAFDATLNKDFLIQSKSK